MLTYDLVLALGAINFFVSSSAALAETSTSPVSLASTSVEGAGSDSGRGRLRRLVQVPSSVPC